MSAPRFDTAAVVLGMHRSGTSALAGVLGLTGFAAPRTLLPSSAVNKRGFWESEALKGLNDELFAELGTNWHGLEAIPLTGFDDRRFHSATLRAEATLIDEFAAASSPLVKDPRLCRLLPLWKPAFASLAARTVYVIILRNPLEVAQSLAERNEFEQDLACLLWARHYLDAEFHTRGLPRVLVAYDRLLEDWRGTLAAIWAGLDLENELDPADEKKVDNYLAVGLRHHCEANERVFADLAHVPLAQQTYRVLLDWASGGSFTNESAVTLDHAREQFDLVSGTLSKVVENARLDRKRLTAARTQAEGTAKELTRARRAMDGLEKLSESVERQSAAQAGLEKRLESTTVSLSKALQERSLLEQTLSDALKAARHERSARERKLALIQRHAEDERRSLDQEQSAARAKLEMQLESTTASLSDALHERSLLEQKLAESLRQAEVERRFLEREQSLVRAGLEKQLESTAASLSEALHERSSLEQKLAESLRQAEVERRSLEQEQSLVRAELESRLESTAASLSEALHERTLLNEKLAETLRQAEEERHSFELVIAQTASARDILSGQFDEVRRDGERTAQKNERDRTQLVEDFEARLRALNLQLSETKSELKDVKRKYRSTQHQLLHDRDKLRRTQDRLAEVEVTLTIVRETLIWRAFAAVDAATRRVTVLVRRAVGRRDRRARVAQLSLLRRSPLFDREWYLNRYPDVGAAGVDAELHYLENGWREGRDPSPSFSTASYLRTNPDVGRSGVNPLLHYIEYGFSEGRHISALSPPASASVVEPGEEFGPATPCATFPLPMDPPVRWRRAARLMRSVGDLLSIAGEPIGIVTGNDEQSVLNDRFVRLAILSGATNARTSSGTSAQTSVRSRKMLDAWYIDHARLRTRWRVDGVPLVVRAYQHSPASDGRLAVVGEGRAISSLDFVDVNLGNPYYPVLFVLAERDGAIRGCELLAFPSLARGGIHYPELLALEREGDSGQIGVFDLVGQSEKLADHLIEITNGTVDAGIGRLTVDLGGADGCEHLFQSAFQSWLQNVIGIGMDPLERDAANAADEYVAGLARLPHHRRETGGTLIVPADTIPTISALVMPRCLDEVSVSEATLSLLIAGIDLSEPATLLHAPQSASPVLTMTAPHHQPAWPRFMLQAGTGISEHFPVAAIRHNLSMPAESELLVPVAQPELPLTEVDQAITWLVFPEDWDGEAFAQGLQVLSLQNVASSPAVVLIGETDPARLSIAHRFLGERVALSSDVTTAINELDTPLVGFLGAHVILHDDRTSKILSMLLEDPQVVSASCVLIATEKRGKGWHVGVADGGTIAGASGQERSMVEQCRAAQLLWHTTYAVLRPPRDLWVSRTSSFKGWLQRAGPLRAEEGIQACTSLVTASYVGDRNERRANLRPPAAAELSAVRIETLFG